MAAGVPLALVYSLVILLRMPRSWLPVTAFAIALAEALALAALVLGVRF